MWPHFKSPIKSKIISYCSLSFVSYNHSRIRDEWLLPYLWHLNAKYLYATLHYLFCNSNLRQSNHRTMGYYLLDAFLFDLMHFSRGFITANRLSDIRKLFFQRQVSHEREREKLYQRNICRLRLQRPKEKGKKRSEVFETEERRKTIEMGRAQRGM